MAGKYSHSRAVTNIWLDSSDAGPPRYRHDDIVANVEGVPCGVGHLYALNSAYGGKSGPHEELRGEGTTWFISS